MQRLWRCCLDGVCNRDEPSKFSVDADKDDRCCLLPLLIGVIAASGANSAGILIMFGLMQMASGLWYRMPMPVQPLKAFAALVIAQKIPGRIIFGGGLAIGVSMFLLSVTGLIDALARLVPKPVVRGIQFGLAL